MKRTFAVVVAIGLTGCGLFHAKEQQPENGSGTQTEDRKNGSPAAKKVYVTYHGPERLTRRFGKFFEIATDDVGIAITGSMRDADAQMEVTITEEDVHERFDARILHAGFVLRGGKPATADYCEQVGSSENHVVFEVADYSRLYAEGLVAKLKKNQPAVVKTFVDPIKSNLDPYFGEIVRRELVKADDVPARNAADADAVLRTMGTTLEPMGLNAIKRRVRIKISGTVNFSYDGNRMFYKSIDEPVSAKAKICLDSAKYYLSPGHNFSSDAFWDSAGSAARALAKL